MKYLVPLFHASCGNQGVGPGTWDVFQTGLGLVLRKNAGAFISPDWNPWWKPRIYPERRIASDARRVVPDRRSGSNELRLRDHPSEVQRIRLAQRRRNSLPRVTIGERRKGKAKGLFLPLELFLRDPFANGYSANGLKSLTLFLAEVCLSKRLYEHWKAQQQVVIPLIFEEPSWSDQDQFSKFREYAVAASLETLRPGTIGWRGPSPSPEHMKLVGEFAGLFPRAAMVLREKLVREFLAGRCDLANVVAALRPEPAYSKKVLFLVWQHRKLKPRAFWEKLRDPLREHGVVLSEKPGSYRKQIGRLKKRALPLDSDFRKLGVT